METNKLTSEEMAAFKEWLGNEIKDKVVIRKGHRTKIT